MGEDLMSEEQISSKHLISDRSVVVAAADQVSCDLGGEAAILDLKSGIYYGLDPVGTRIWSLIQQPKAVRDIREASIRRARSVRTRCDCARGEARVTRTGRADLLSPHATTQLMKDVIQPLDVDRVLMIERIQRYARSLGGQIV